MEYMRAPPPKAADSIFLNAASHSKISDLIKLLEQKEANVNCQNTNGATALHIACVNQLSNVVKVLLHFGANTDLEEFQFAGKRTPLHYSIKNGNYLISKLLLDAGANPNLKDDQGTTPLHMAAKGGHVDLAELLLNYGADPYLRDNIGNNPSYYADQLGHKAVAAVLPGVLKITTAQMSEFREQYLRVHDIVDRRKKGKKKAGGKKKK